ncbi:MAG: hypothetical protein H0U10_12080 [Chloroflexia bacterium]|nr:hypothetical protein [Chloroflexia bacterium]
MDDSPPGLILDDLYRVLGERDPASVRLVVAAVEPSPSIVRIRYALVGADGEPVLDADHSPIVMVGGIDPEPPSAIRPGDSFPVPPKRAAAEEPE